MKKRFLSGCILLGPLVISFWVFSSIVSLFTAPIQKIIQLILHHFHVCSDTIITYISYFLAIAILLLFATMLGCVAEKYVSRSCKAYLDDLLLRIPLFSDIYGVCKRVVAGLFIEKKAKKPSVVLSSFMNPEQKTLAIVTNTVVIGKEEYVITMLPSTPNPTGAYLVLTPKNAVQPLPDTSVEQAFRFVISGGSSSTTL